MVLTAQANHFIRLDEKLRARQEELQKKVAILKLERSRIGDILAKGQRIAKEGGTSETSALEDPGQISQATAAAALISLSSQSVPLMCQATAAAALSSLSSQSFPLVCLHLDRA